MRVEVITATMEGPPPPESLKEERKTQEKNKTTKEKHDNTGNNSERQKESVKSKAQGAKAQKKNVGKKKSEGRKNDSHIVSQIFTLTEIANNKEASNLISDLVKCYTSNSTLPEKELDVLNKTLYEKTVSLFLQVLNRCVDKIFMKVLSTEVFKNELLSKKIPKKDACCQTDVSYMNY